MYFSPKKIEQTYVLIILTDYLPAFNYSGLGIQFYLPKVLAAHFDCIPNNFTEEGSIRSFDDLEPQLFVNS